MPGLLNRFDRWFKSHDDYPMTNLGIPAGTYFISHSYKDSAVRDRMIQQLPAHIKPYIFPPISVRPDQFVSNNLIEAILKCNGVIYLDEGYSAQSFWVAFERDYALRSRKRVYRYIPSSNRCARHSAPPLDLAVFASYRRTNQDIMREVVQFMQKQRFFDVFVDAMMLQSGHKFASEITTALVDSIQRGGYMLLFWSREAANSEWIAREIEMGLKYNRVVIAALDDTPLPDAVLAESVSPICVHLLDEQGLNSNRIDDLIVRLYWLMFRNQCPELIYDQTD